MVKASSQFDKCPGCDGKRVQHVGSYSLTTTTAVTRYEGINVWCLVCGGDGVVPAKSYSATSRELVN